MESRQLVLIARAINYHAGMQKFTVVFISDLNEITKIAGELEGAGDSLQIAVCGLTSRQKGTCIHHPV